MVDEKAHLLHKRGGDEFMLQPTSTNQHNDASNPDENAQVDQKVGLSDWMTGLFVVGEVIGVAILALPDALANTGWSGVLLIILCFVASSYTGSILGKSWIIIRQHYPEVRGHVRNPYPMIGQLTFGRWMRHLVSVVNNVCMFGVVTVYIIFASQNVTSILATLGVSIPFCYVILIVLPVVIPLTWFKSPKDFWQIGIVSLSTVLVSILIICIYSVIVGSRGEGDIPRLDPTMQSFSMAFGTIVTSCGGAVLYPTLQNDMKKPEHFPKMVVIATICICAISLTSSIMSYWSYGSDVQDNVIMSLPLGIPRLLVEIFMTLHVIAAIIILGNGMFQDAEEILNVPKEFGWRRVLLRSSIVLVAGFVAESLPRFGALVSLIGGGCVVFSTYLAPCLFYWRLSMPQENFKPESLSIYIKGVLVVIVVTAVIGGIAATYAAIYNLTSSATFVLPCYINMTAVV